MYMHVMVEEEIETFRVVAQLIGREKAVSKCLSSSP